MYLGRVCIMLVLCAAMLGSSASWAAHPLLTDDTGTQGTGKFQIEASGIWLSDKSNVEGTETKEVDSFATVVFTGGVAEALDLMITVPYVWTETSAEGTTAKESGLSDMVIEAKWRFFEKEKLSLAFKPGVLIPTGNDEKGLGTGHYGYTAFLISTLEGEMWSFDANLGFLHLENRVDERVDRWFASLSTRCKVSEKWNIVGEIGSAKNTDPEDSTNPVFAQIGLIFAPKDNLDLSAGYMHGITETEVDHTIRAGVTFKF